MHQSRTDDFGPKRAERIQEADTQIARSGHPRYKVRRTCARESSVGILCSNRFPRGYLAPFFNDVGTQARRYLLPRYQEIRRPPEEITLLQTLSAHRATVSYASRRRAFACPAAFLPWSSLIGLARAGVAAIGTGALKS